MIRIKKGDDVLIKITITDSDEEMHASGNISADDEMSVMVNLDGYASVIVDALTKKAKTKTDRIVLKHTLRCMKFMYSRGCYEEAIGYMADIFQDEVNSEVALPVEDLPEELDHDEGFCEYFLEGLFLKFTEAGDKYSFLKEDDDGEV